VTALLRRHGAPSPSDKKSTRSNTSAGASEDAQPPKTLAARSTAADTEAGIVGDCGSNDEAEKSAGEDETSGGDDAGDPKSGKVEEGESDPPTRSPALPADTPPPQPLLPAATPGAEPTASPYLASRLGAPPALSSLAVRRSLSQVNAGPHAAVGGATGALAVAMLPTSPLGGFQQLESPDADASWVTVRTRRSAAEARQKGDRGDGAVATGPSANAAAGGMTTAPKLESATVVGVAALAASSTVPLLAAMVSSLTSLPPPDACCPPPSPTASSSLATAPPAVATSPVATCAAPPPCPVLSPTLEPPRLATAPPAPAPPPPPHPPEASPLPAGSPPVPDDQRSVATLPTDWGGYGAGAYDTPMRPSSVPPQSDWPSSPLVPLATPADAAGSLTCGSITVEAAPPVHKRLVPPAAGGLPIVADSRASALSTSVCSASLTSSPGSPRPPPPPLAPLPLPPQSPYVPAVATVEGVSSLFFPASPAASLAPRRSGGSLTASSSPLATAWSAARASFPPPPDPQQRPRRGRRALGFDRATYASSTAKGLALAVKNRGGSAAVTPSLSSGPTVATTASETTISATSLGWPASSGEASMDLCRPHRVSPDSGGGHSAPAPSPALREPPQQAGATALCATECVAPKVSQKTRRTSHRRSRRRRRTARKKAVAGSGGAKKRRRRTCGRRFARSLGDLCAFPWEFWLLCGADMMGTGILYSFLAFFTDLATEKFGLDPEMAGRITSVASFVAVTVGPLGGLPFARGPGSGFCGGVTRSQFSAMERHKSGLGHEELGFAKLLGSCFCATMRACSHLMLAPWQDGSSTAWATRCSFSLSSSPFLQLPSYSSRSRCALPPRDTLMARRTTGTAESRSASQSCCVVWNAKDGCHGEQGHFEGRRSHFEDPALLDICHDMQFTMASPFIAIIALGLLSGLQPAIVYPVMSKIVSERRFSTAQVAPPQPKEESRQEAFGKTRGFVVDTNEHV